MLLLLFGAVIVLPCIQIPFPVHLIITALTTLLLPVKLWSLLVEYYCTTLLLETNKTWTMNWTLDSIMDLIVGLTGILIPCI